MAVGPPRIWMSLSVTEVTRLPKRSATRTSPSTMLPSRRALGKGRRTGSARRGPRRDVVSEIHQARLGADAEHDPLHDADPGIARPEIGRERNDRHGH